MNASLYSPTQSSSSCQEYFSNSSSLITTPIDKKDFKNHSNEISSSSSIESKSSRNSNKRSRILTNIKKNSKLKTKKNNIIDESKYSNLKSNFKISNKIKTEFQTESKLKNVECFLESDDLWKKFNSLGTEMIITKSGRRMFPSLRVSFSGVQSNQKYLIAMDIVPTDNKRYRYAYHRSSWLVAGKADPPVQSRLFLHPDGPFTGESLQKQIISFEKLKLTNNETNICGHVSFFLFEFKLLLLILLIK